MIGRGVMLSLKATQFVALVCLSIYYILRDPEAASLSDVIFLGEQYFRVELPPHLADFGSLRMCTL